MGTRAMMGSRSVDGQGSGGGNVAVYCKADDGWLAGRWVTDGFRIAGLLVLALAAAGCSARAKPEAVAPSHFVQIRDPGMAYAHNHGARPCYSFELADPDWRLEESKPDWAQFSRLDGVLRVYFVDNRDVGFAVGGMEPEDALRAFIGAEAAFIKPLFQFQSVESPKLAEDDNGIWVQWAWEGRAGNRRGAGSRAPVDQRHVVASLWMDPWVLSFDWATTEVDADYFGPTPEMIDMLESLRFHPACFTAMRTGETWSP